MIGESTPRSRSRYYVLQVIRAVKNSAGDLEPDLWIVHPGEFCRWLNAWQAAAVLRARHPGLVFIAGELIPQYLPRSSDG